MKESLEDLSAQARRGTLDASERRRLKLMLAASAEGRLLDRAGCDFDREDSVQAGDDAIASRVVERVLARAKDAPAARRPRTWALLGVAACLVTAASAGAARHYRRAFEARPPATLVEPGPPAVGPREAVAAFAPKPAVAPEPAAVVPTAPKPLPAAPSASPPPASELFANAARARREGNLEEALRLYVALQHRYPGAPESRAADISLAMIQLGRGADAASLEHFQRYLRHSPDGELVPEALWGQAEALRKLGRSEEARRALGTLLMRFPDSTYAAAARARLEASKSTP